MFEFSFAKKYLIPNKKKLSVSLISLLSCLVISLVVWLLLVFLSVTEGIEERWLTKMTSINAPIRIVPTEKYYNSHYYLVDKLCAASNYSTKSIYEKLVSDEMNPHDPMSDEAPPPFWPKPLEIDLVKTAFSQVKQIAPQSTQVNDYQVTAGMIRLNLVRQVQNSLEESFISQASYITQLPESNEGMHALHTSPSIDDLNHTLFLARLNDCSNTLLHRIFDNIVLHKVESSQHRFVYPKESLDGEFVAYVDTPEAYKVSQVILPSSQSRKVQGYHKAKLVARNQKCFISLQGKEVPLATRAVVLSDEPLAMNASIATLDGCEQLRDVILDAQALVQGKTLHMKLPFHNLKVTDAAIRCDFENAPTFEPLWAYTLKGNTIIPLGFSRDQGIIVPKSLRHSGIQIGDRATISYHTFSGSTTKEMRIPVVVSGFYDPGAMAMGSRYLLAPRNIVQTIASSTSSQSLDPLMSNGIQVWLDDIHTTPQTVSALQTAFENAQIASYFNIVPYYEFEFAKDLIQQLGSDRTLLTLVGIMILAIAACNIVSLLMLLVNDKRREIGIMRAMGASTKSIALLFALCGLILGVISFGIGTLGALLTLHNIDGLVHFLSSIQGHPAFNVDIYGEHLPNALSHRALIIMAIATPIVSLIAGLFPAMKATRISPTQILRNET